MAKIITVPDDLETGDFFIDTIFLAGGITNCSDWQSYIIEKIKNINDIIIFNPRREKFDLSNKSLTNEQIEWEHRILSSTTTIAFWFSKGSVNPIALYELGRYGTSSDIKIFIGIDPEYERKDDIIIQTSLDRPEIAKDIVYSLDELAKQIIDFFI